MIVVIRTKIYIIVIIIINVYHSLVVRNGIPIKGVAIQVIYGAIIIYTLTFNTT